MREPLLSLLTGMVCGLLMNLLTRKAIRTPLMMWRIVQAGSFVGILFLSEWIRGNVLQISAGATWSFIAPYGLGFARALLPALRELKSRT